MSENKIPSAKEAMDRIREVIKEDKAIACVWHLNITTACINAMASSGYTDSYARNKTANDAASRFMKHMFDVETSKDMLEE